MSFDFTMINEDHCIYVKKSNGKFVILSLYVDDILLAGKNLEYLKIFKSWLSKSLYMKDMGEKTIYWVLRSKEIVPRNF